MLPERGPLQLVELLIRHGAIEWLPDEEGRTPLEAARLGRAADRDGIVELLDRPVIRDPGFRAAVAAIHGGDVPALERVLRRASRGCCEDRIREPSCYRDAPASSTSSTRSCCGSSPTTRTWSTPMPANIVEVTRALLARGAGGLDVTLGLVIASEPARVRATRSH